MDDVRYIWLYPWLARHTEPVSVCRLYGLLKRPGTRKIRIDRLVWALGLQMIGCEANLR